MHNQSLLLQALLSYLHMFGAVDADVVPEVLIVLQRLIPLHGNQDLLLQLQGVCTSMVVSLTKQ
jgi:hypothetical protein